MADRDADSQSVPGEAPHEPPTEEPRAAEHHNRGHGIPPPPGWARSSRRATNDTAASPPARGRGAIDGATAMPTHSAMASALAYDGARQTGDDPC
jgi:hypothetical protein